MSENYSINEFGQKEISLTKVIQLLNTGYVRIKADKNRDPELGSIEEYFDLTPSQVKALFKHPELKGRKVKLKKDIGFVVLEDAISEDPLEAVLNDLTIDPELGTLEDAETASF